MNQKLSKTSSRSPELGSTYVAGILDQKPSFKRVSLGHLSHPPLGTAPPTAEQMLPPNTQRTRQPTPTGTYARYGTRKTSKVYTGLCTAKPTSQPQGGYVCFRMMLHCRCAAKANGIALVQDVEVKRTTMSPNPQSGNLHTKYDMTEHRDQVLRQSATANWHGRKALCSNYMS